MSENLTKKDSYARAGVNIEAGNHLVERIKQKVKSTHRPGVMGGIGGFGALFDLSSLNYKNPVLVSGTDGVGTKIKLAIDSGRHDTIGIDLVAMCVNDLLVQGAEPLFFLDYFACSSLDIDVAENVIAGIASGCKLAGCALVGGETAEMPGMYEKGDYDLAGFCVGAVEKDAIIDGSKISEGDAIIGVASSGVHSNGFSLVRHILAESNTNPDDLFESDSFLNVLLEPTRIYTKPVSRLLENISVNGISHITGGGLLENIPRVLSPAIQANINEKSWQWPAIFQWLKTTGKVETEEMYRTFNCGVGLVLFVRNEDAETAINCLNEAGEQAWLLGEVSRLKKDTQVVIG